MNGVSLIPPALRGGRARLGAWLRRGVTLASLSLRAAQPAVRRGLDVLGAGAGLVVAAPVIALGALAVQASSPGPVFYAQERIGRHGRRFRMLKLRTMITNADSLKSQLEAQQREAASNGVRFKLKRDPRVTPAGRWLRKLSIDELPQLYNVLVGDMTLIGPRPAVEREVVLYDARALRRLEVVQGLTCLWQVGGRSDLSFEEQVELDVTYVDRASLLGDLSILLRTVPAVLTGKGAY